MKKNFRQKNQRKIKTVNVTGSVLGRSLAFEEINYNDRLLAWIMNEKERVKNFEDSYKKRLKNMTEYPSALQ